MVTRVYKTQNITNHSSEVEAMKYSLAAAKIASIKQPFSDIEKLLHDELVKSKADAMTCLKAWALMTDIISHEALNKHHA